MALLKGAALAAYPLDTIRRRMMMQSAGGAVSLSIFFLHYIVAGIHSNPHQTKYKNFIHAAQQIIAKEGTKALFGQYYVSFPEVSNVLINPRSAGAGANILRGVASAGVLAIYDKYVPSPL